MRNIIQELSQLLNIGTEAIKLSRVKGITGEDLWLVADAISSAEQIVSATGLNVGDYVLHDDREVKHNLGPVVVTAVSV